MLRYILAILMCLGYDSRAYIGSSVVLSQWDGEVQLELHYRGPGKLVTYQVSNGIEVGITLDARPNSNVFDFAMRGYEDLDFFPQGELTSEEIAMGAVRPANVIDSIAVYHKTKRDHVIGRTNYMAGKLWHIYRVEVNDHLKKTVYGHMEVRNGHLLVSVPQDFLDRAVYPVFVDPTFGYSMVGATGATLASYIVGSHFQATDNAVMTSLSLYANAGPGNFNWTGAIYSSTGTTASGGIKIGITAGANAAPNSIAKWFSQPIAGTLTSSEHYGILYQSDPTFGGLQTFYDSGANWSYLAHTYTAGVFPDPMSTMVNASNQKFSSYVTYTISGSGPAPVGTNPAKIFLRGRR